ncbi:ABC transporter permease [Sedimentibacter sp. zth1]|uniref:ABC transporter permease n=1 Tax=Sedimentibacter sp. zth1 TaxID=2816908 RepID=UPI001A92E691|nr:ABC transporter permease [Sedimentibacter sp. zth1]QSX05861.1 ABC transporter permease [Sedimentibacter sp. zth1]
MIKFIFKRIIRSIPVIILVMVLSFFIIHLMPGDPIRTMLGDKAPQEQILSMQKELNLDKPIIQQFFIWTNQIFHFDLGTSIFWKEPIIDIILKRIEPTMILALIAIVISILIGLPTGLLAAKKHGKFFDKFFSVLSLISISLPAFWIAIILIQLLCVKISIFPVSGYHRIADVGLLTSLYELLLPGIILGIMHSGQIARMTRTTMLDVLEQDYLRTARAKGVKEKQVINIHAFINALLPIVMIVGFSFANLLGGAAVIEQLFNIPGTGNLAITAILSRDYPLIQGTLLFVAVIFIIMNMIVDIICGLINPKTRCE